MIPKVIHYCWFGRNPKPELIEKCIDSWRKFCPDYEVIEWNEDNFDVNSIPYTADAYAAKNGLLYRIMRGLKLSMTMVESIWIQTCYCITAWMIYCNMIAGWPRKIFDILAQVWVLAP